ncbi:FadR/GntR family transcriptional regulator [Paraburkholderia caribensis]|uniref:FadR/GntR family transcriptional regulator n=1 Tax=Paraburkholderia caribensis TaxID=75105 RepID=UPI0034D20528
MNKDSLVKDTLDSLVEIVVALGAGAMLPPQDVLARQLEVSRTVLREALSKLEYLNMISVRPKSGTTVKTSSEWRVVNLDVLEWRVRAGEDAARVAADTMSAARICAGVQ